MATYILRDLPPDLWNRVKARADRERRPLRPLILELLERYTALGLDGTSPATTSPAIRLTQPLRLKPNMRIGDAPLATPDAGEIVTYDVLGMPPGRSAIVKQRYEGEPGWTVVDGKTNEDWFEWSQTFDTPEDARAALQANVEWRIASSTW